MVYIIVHLETGKWNFYNGIVKGTTAAFSETPVLTRAGYEVATGEEDTYKTAFLSTSSFYIVPNDKTILMGNTGTATIGGSGYGTLTPSSSNTNVATATISGTTLTINPVAAGTATITVTEANEGRTATCSVTVLSGNYSITSGSEKTYYDQIGVAMAAATDGQTIKMEQNVTNETSQGVIAGNKNITLDIQNYTLTSSKGITLYGGTLNLQGTGTIQSSYSQVIYLGGSLGVLNVGTNLTIKNTSTYTYNSAIATSNNGVLNMSNGTLQGSYKAISMWGGTINISGGIAETTVTTGDNRYTIYISPDSKDYVTTANITGGTVRGGAYGVYCNYSNGPTINIGNPTNALSTESPVILGEKSGLYSINAQAGIWNFYNGILKGATSAYNIEPTEMRYLCDTKTGTETINGTTYQTGYLEQYSIENYYNYNVINPTTGTATG